MSLALWYISTPIEFIFVEPSVLCWLNPKKDIFNFAEKDKVISFSAANLPKVSSIDTSSCSKFSKSSDNKLVNSEYITPESPINLSCSTRIVLSFCKFLLLTASNSVRPNVLYIVDIFSASSISGIKWVSKLFLIAEVTWLFKFLFKSKLATILFLSISTNSICSK